MALPPMPLRTASNLTFFYALGYPIGALAVSAMSPMAVLVCSRSFPRSRVCCRGWCWASGRTSESRSASSSERWRAGW